MADAVMVSSSFLPGQGGIESYLAELCDRLSPRIAVLAPATRDGKAIPADLSYAVRGYPGSLLVPTRKVVDAIEEWAGEMGTDRILFGTPWPLALLGPRLEQRGLRYAAIVHGAELLVPAAVPVVRKKLIRALAAADVLLPVSHFTQNRLGELIAGIGLQMPPSEILRARVDLDRFSPNADGSGVRESLGLEQSTPIVLVFGRLVRRKGVHRLIDVMPRVTERVPGAALVIGGTGPEKRRLARRARNSRGRIVFAGRVPDADAPGLFAAADVFSLPVKDRWFGLEVEGLGVVLLEAQACETPCVAGRSGGTVEAVLDGRTGFLVDAGDETRLVDALVELLSDRPRARAMGKAGREFVKTEFSGRQLPGSLIDWLERRQTRQSTDQPSQGR